MPFSEEFLTFKRRGTSNIAAVDTILFHKGDIGWAPSADHIVVTSYEARIRAENSSTIILAINVGKPHAHPTSGLCYARIATPLMGLTTGNYTVSVAAIAPGGTTDSAISSGFSLPLS